MVTDELKTQHPTATPCFSARHTASARTGSTEDGAHAQRDEVCRAEPGLQCISPS